LKGEKHVAAHLDDRSYIGALWQLADVASQQGMGILPKRRDRFGAGDPLNTISDGPFVGELVVTRAASDRHRQLHLRRFYR